MSQTGYTPIQLYYSTTASNTPSVANLSLGELGINLADQKAYMLNAAGTAVVTLVGTLGNQNANSVSITGGSVNGTTIGATTASTGAFTTISATGVITSTVATGTAPFTIASTTQVANLNAATAGTATNATNVGTTDNTSSSSTYYPTLVSATSGNNPITTSSTKLSFVPSTGILTSTGFSGAHNGTVGATTPNTGAFTTITASSTITPTSTVGIVGTTTNDNVQAGSFGEYVSSTISSGSSITLTTSGTVYNVTSISLTAGDWDVTGIVLYTSSNGTTTFSYIQSGSTSTSATLGGSGTYSSGSYGNALLGAIVDFSQPVPTIRYSLSSTTTIYLFARASWGVLTPSAYGTIRARRVR